jgi:hypothetical protein
VPPNTCDKCGASLQPGARQCPYCQTTTPYGLQAQQTDIQQQQWSAAQAQQTLLQAQLLGGGRIEAAATAALLWSLASIVFFCIPIPAIAGVVMGLRARSLAQSLRLSAPVRGTVGLVISALSGVGFVVFMIWAVVSSQHDVAQINKRKTELEKQIGAKATAATLDQSTACAMAELKILSEGHNGSSTYFQDYECLGKVSGDTDRASLEDFQYKESGTGPIKKITLCFKHGARWHVDNVLDEGKCADDPSAGAASAVVAVAAPPAHVAGAGGARSPGAHDASQQKADGGAAAATPVTRDAGAIRR